MPCAGAAAALHVAARALTGTCQLLPVDDGRGRRPAPSILSILRIFGRADPSSMLLLLLRAVPVTLKGKPLLTEQWTLCCASRPVQSHVGSCVFHHMGGPVFRMTAMSLFVEGVLFTHGVNE